MMADSSGIPGRTPTEPVCVRDLVSLAQGRGLPRIDAQMIALVALTKSPGDRAWLLSHDTDTVSPDVLARWNGLLERRLDGLPMAYLTGFQEFFGLKLTVGPGVLVPRPDTEALVQWGLDCLQAESADSSAVSALDLGTGSGAIALAIKSHARGTQVAATDASEVALEIARRNAEALGLDLELIAGNRASWWAPVNRRSFNVIVSNPPYIEDGDSHLEALQHEPPCALTSGSDGLDDIRQIIEGAPLHLSPGGWLLLEHGYNQAEAVRELLIKRGFSDVTSRMDLAGIERCSGGRWMPE